MLITAREVQRSDFVLHAVGLVEAFGREIAETEDQGGNLNVIRGAERAGWVSSGKGRGARRRGEGDLEDEVVVVEWTVGVVFQWGDILSL